LPLYRYVGGVSANCQFQWWILMVGAFRCAIAFQEFMIFL
jgi:hypothetical protein